MTESGREHLEAARASSRVGHVLFAFWHGRQLPLVYRWRAHDIAILTSLSKDGALQSLVLSGLGYHIQRGSSSRGGVRGLVGMIRALQAGRDGAFAVDGPRGPLHAIKPGILYAARKTGFPIVPISVGARSVRRLDRAWDRYLLPRPFTRTVVAYGPPIPVPADASDEDLERISGVLEAALHEVTAEADRQVQED